MALLVNEPKSIEARLRSIQTFLDGGFPPEIVVTNTDFELLTKAFRLKHFGRCPVCGEPGVSVHAETFKSTRRYTHCCGWSREVTDREIVAAEHIDDVIINLCKTAKEAT